MSDDEVKPDAVIVEQPEARDVKVPPGYTARIYAAWVPQPKCMNCGAPLKFKVWQAFPPQGHDDNITYQEIVALGVHKCTCAVQLAAATKPALKLIIT